MVVQQLLAPATLPTTTGNTLSVLSYNILLPNSIDGWWNYKMYLPPLGKDNLYISSWDYRKKLLQERIAIVNPHVVCFQEVAPASFIDDFSFMQDLGYDGHEMFKKGRFRPATFWRSSYCELAAPPVHKDRTLLTAFRIKNDDDSDNNRSNNESVQQQSTGGSNKNWYILNCHLQAGREGKRRLRQINEGVRAAVTLARKLKDKEPEKRMPLIVCGDFNGGPESAAVRYIEDGFVDERFMEDGEQTTSSRKEMPLQMPLIDVPGQVKDRVPPDTLVVPELISLLTQGDAYDNPEFSNDAIDRLSRIYDKYASCITNNDNSDNSAVNVMNFKDVERWLIDINGQVGWGSEFREAARQMGWEEPPTSTENADESIPIEKSRIELPTAGVLTLEGFINVYHAELRQGKFWGIAHDLAVMGEALPEIGVFKARFDRMYCSSVVGPTAVIDFVGTNKPCPNEMEPSDHLPVAASFALKSAEL